MTAAALPSSAPSLGTLPARALLVHEIHSCSSSLGEGPHETHLFVATVIMWCTSLILIKLFRCDDIGIGLA